MSEIVIQNLTATTGEMDTRDKMNALAPLFARHLQNGLSYDEAFAKAARDFLALWEKCHALSEKPGVDPRK